MEDGSSHAPSSLTAQQDKQRYQEVLQQQSVSAVRRQGKWTYLKLHELNDNNPSRKDGLEQTKEMQWRRQYVTLISKAGMNLKM